MNLQKLKKYLITPLTISAVIFSNLFFTAKIAYADIAPVEYITPDGNTNTTIDRAQNGTPVVNIAAPSASGVSHNTFSDYNVTEENLILNNLKGDVGVSQLGGALYGNSNFRGAAADVILNEVTGNKITNLAGYTEIFGQRAALVIANPNGIVTRGAGFLNTSRLSLVSGKPNLNNDGSIKDFDINPSAQVFITARNVVSNQNGVDFIIPLGLDASSADFVDIISRTVAISGQIYAKGELNIKTGNDKYDYQTGNISSKNDANLNNTKPTLAIDSTYFGGMYAGRINFIASEEGVGVKTIGDLSSNVDDIKIDAKGNVEYANVGSARNFEVKAQNIKQNDSFVSANNNIKLEAENNIDFSNAAIVYTLKDLEITAANQVNNKGAIIANSINISADSINNEESNNAVISYNGFLLNKGLSASSNIDLKANYIKNKNGLIAADKNLNIENVLILDNESGNLSAKENLNIKNSEEVLNKNGLIIASLTLKFDNVQNIKNQNGSVIAKDLEAINIESFNNNFGQIYTFNNLVINNLDNNDGLVEALGNIAIINKSTIYNKILNENGVIKALSQTGSISLQSTQVIGSLGSILSAGNIDMTISDDLNIIGIIQAAGHINISAGNITNQSTLQANNYIEFNATGFFLNDELASIISNASVTINASTDISNKGIIAANTDLNLVAGNNIFNYAPTIPSGSTQSQIDNLYSKFGFIIGGAGTTTITANNGTILNQNKILAQNNLILNSNKTTFDANDLNSSGVNNSGQIAANNNLTINSKTFLINKENALIFAGNNFIANVDDFIANISSTIFAQNNLVLQSSVAGTGGLFKNNKIENISGNITAYSGNMFINSNELNNKRTEMKVQNAEVRAQTYNSFHHHEYHYDLTAVKSFSGNVGLISQITSGGNLTINGGSVLNDSSNIFVKGNLTITADSFNNNSNYFESYTKYHDWWDDLGDWNHLLDNTAPNNYHQEVYASIIKANGTITINVTNNFSNAIALSQAPDEIVATALSQNFVNVDPNLTDILSSGVVDVAKDVVVPTGQNGLFKQSPNNKYLIENNAAFLDTSQFLGSNYFLTRLGFDPNVDIIQQRLGDNVYEQQLIISAIKNLTKGEYLGNGVTSDYQQMQLLFDNAFDEYTLFNADANITDLEIGKALTKEQQQALTKDIIWLVEKEINGKKVLVTELYLASTTLDKLKNNQSVGSVIKGNNIQITAGNNIFNQGNILSSNALILNAGNNFTNKSFGANAAKIRATDLLINAGNSIENFNSLMHARNSLTLNAGNNITNETNVVTRDYGSHVFGAINQNTATISSDAQNNGSIVLIAENDINNIGANITNKNSSGNSGNIILQAGDDINITSAVVRNRSEFHSKKLTVISDETKNIGSDIESSGNITLTSTGLGTDNEFATAQANYQTALNKYNDDLAQYQIDLANYQIDLTKYQETSLGGGRIGKLKTTAPTAPNKPTEPTLSDFMTDPAIGSSILVNGSNIVAVNDLTLNASDNAIITNAIDSDYHYSKTIKKGSLKTVTTTSEDYVETAVSSNLSGRNININAGNNIFVQGSNLNSRFDLLTNSGGNTNLNAGGSTTITNAVLQEYHHHSKEVSNNGVFKVVTAINSAGIALGSITLQVAINSMNTIAKILGQEDLSKKVSRTYKEKRDNAFYNTKTKNTDNLDSAKIVSSNVEAGNDLSITSNKTTTIQGSNLASGTADLDNQGNANPIPNPAVTGKLEINSNNLNILGATSYESKTSDERTKGTFSIKNYNITDFKTDVTNSTLNAKNNNFTFSINNQVTITAKDLNNPEVLKASYVAALKGQISSNNIEEVNIELITKHMEEANRQMTEVAIATIAVAAVIATIVTAGAAGFAVVGTTAAATASAGTIGLTMIGVSVVGAAVSTAATSGASASMNADGDFFKQTKDIGKDTWDATTSDDALKSYLIAGATAALTFGITQGLDAALTTTVTTGSNVVSNGSNLVSTGSNLLDNFSNALIQNGISSISSSVAQSAINGDSFSDALKNAMKNAVIMAVAQMGASAIGDLAHTAQTDIHGNALRDSSGNIITKINTTEQLALHALLGCGAAAAGGNDCAIGAMSGVAGELVGSLYRDRATDYYANQNQANNPILKDNNIKLITTDQLNQMKFTGEQIAKMTGALTAAVTGGDANDVWAGSAIAGNAAANNALDTVVDGVFVVADVTKIVYGKYIGDDGMVHEGLVDLAGDGTAFLIPFAPAGGTRVARLLKKDEVVKLTKKGPELNSEHSINFLDEAYTNRQASGDEIFYRYHGKDNRTGQEVTYLTNKKYDTESQLRQGLAIDPEWGVNIENVTTFKPQQGTWITEGFAAPKGIYKGGDYQAIINTNNLPKSTIIKTDNFLSNYGIK